jgi:hypothetical protein
MERKAVNGVPFLGYAFPLSDELPALDVAKVYVSLMADLEQSRVLDVVADRTAEACQELWTRLGPSREARVPDDLTVAISLRSL